MRLSEENTNLEHHLKKEKLKVQDLILKADARLQRIHQLEDLEKKYKEQIHTLQENYKKKCEELERFVDDSLYKDTPSSEDIDKFYDCVIDINDLRSLILKGWNIRTSPDYDKIKKNVGTIMAVVGGYGKGKTYLMEQLSKKPLPHGHNVHTKGASVIHLGNKENSDGHTPIIGLDTKGGYTPMDISPLMTQGMNDEEFSAKLKEIFRDHQATEDMIQNFVLDQANVIIVVVADLTFDDQQLVNKIRRKFADKSRKKKVIVVHNLFHTQRIEDVKSKINENILKSFALKTVRYTTALEGKNCHYYEDSNFQDFVIPHVVLAKKGSEAGNFYNESTIRFIQSCLECTGDQKSIDVVEALKTFLTHHIKSYIDIKQDINIQVADNKMTLPLQPLPNANEETKPDLKMKPVSFDEFGILNTLQGSFEPNHIVSVSMRKDRPDKLHVFVECPGVEPSSIRYGVQIDDTQEYHIEIHGKVSSEQMLANNQKSISNTTKQGLFCVKTEPLNRVTYNIDNIPEGRSLKDGYLQLTYKIKEFQPFQSFQQFEDIRQSPNESLLTQ